MIFSQLMKIKNALLNTWDDLRTSYWFLPVIFALSSIVFSQVLLSIDRNYGAEYVSLSRIFYTGSAEGARLILSTIAGSMMGIAGVVFSITMVTLALASKQFGPRILRNFMRDSLNQVVLGTFISTFIFCVLVLRELHGQDGDNYSKFIPQISMMTAVILAGASIAVLIYYIHHMATSIQAPLIIAKLRKEMLHGIHTLYPEKSDDVVSAENEKKSELQFQEMLKNRELIKVHASEGGYIRRIDDELLEDLAFEHDLVLTPGLRPGDFVMSGEAVFHIWVKSKLKDELKETIASTLILGSERTQEQDIRFTIDQIVGICLMALSPSVNDPFTARQCIDVLGEALVFFSQRRDVSQYINDENGVPRVKVVRMNFGEIIGYSFNEIRLNAIPQIGVSQYIIEVLLKVAKMTTNKTDVEIIKRHARLVFEHVQKASTNDYDHAKSSSLLVEVEAL